MKTDDLPQERTDLEAQNSLCEACGTEFYCGAQIERCWCFETKLPALALAEIRQKYDKCLCSYCLTQAGEIFPD